MNEWVVTTTTVATTATTAYTWMSLCTRHRRRRRIIANTQPIPTKRRVIVGTAEAQQPVSAGMGSCAQSLRSLYDVQKSSNNKIQWDETIGIGQGQGKWWRDALKIPRLCARCCCECMKAENGSGEQPKINPHNNVRHVSPHHTAPQPMRRRRRRKQRILNC